MLRKEDLAQIEQRGSSVQAVEEQIERFKKGFPWMKIIAPATPERGIQVLDEAAVAAALRSGKLRGAAMDVAAMEPIPADSPLLTAPNCILTPHMAWAPMEARQRIIDIALDNIRGFLDNQPINVVNL